MQYFQVAVNGILLGGLYALMALGMSLIWGVMDIINIAHGVFIMLGAYTTYWMFALLGIDPFISIVASIILMFCLGFIAQKFLINLVIRADIFITLLLAFGIEIFLMNLVRVLWKSDFRRVTVSYAGDNLQLAGVTIPVVRLAAFAVVIILTIILYIILEKTKLGMAIRATSQNLEAARLMGINVAVTYAMTFGIGVALAGAAGTLWSIIFPITPIMGGPLTLKSFVVTIIGGLGTMVGPVIGGLFLGVVEAFGSSWFGSTYQNFISFLMLVLVLIFMPHGLLGWRKK